MASNHMLLDIGGAVKALKSGKHVKRESWPEGDVAWLKPATTIQSDWCHDAKLKRIVDSYGGTIPAMDTLSVCMGGVIHTGWLPSLSDVLAEDWMIV